MRWSMIATWKMSYDGVKKGTCLLKNNKSAKEAVLEAIHEVEKNENYYSVGYSGLPNEQGVVQCDAGFMDGETLQAGAVGALEDVVHAVDVAYECSKGRFNNVLVGEGANEFASSLGIKKENLLTKESYEKYLQRKEEKLPLSSYDGHDTVGMVALDQQGHLVSATSTSGLFMKKKGRIGDSPLIGSGFYCDDEAGGAAATGVGEEIMRGCLSYEAVRRMKEGMSAQQAASSTVYEWTEKMILKKGYCDAISLICMNVQGEVGIGTNIKFAFVCADENHEPQVFVAIPDGKDIILRAYDDHQDHLD